MRTLRSRLGVWSAAWLLCQLASICAFLPLTANPQAAALVECLVSTPGDMCPMRDANGVPCPMHQEQEAVHSHGAEEDCRMNAVGGGPAAALAALFSMPGVLPQAGHALTFSDEALISVPTFDLFDAPVSHDTPPPRA